MKSFNLFLLASVFVAQLAGASECKIPTGEVTEWPGFASSGAIDQNLKLHTFIKPSDDCKSVKIFQTIGKTVAEPTLAQCAQLGGDFSPFPGYVSCFSYPVGSQPKLGMGALLPYAYLSPEGKLVTLHHSNYDALVESTFARSEGGKISGIYKFHMDQNPVQNEIIELRATIREINQEISEKEVELNRAKMVVLHGDIKRLKQAREENQKRIKELKLTTKALNNEACPTCSELSMKPVEQGIGFHLGLGMEGQRFDMDANSQVAQ